MTRRGLTLVELLITLVVFGILATAMTRLMISNSRFVSRQETLLEARQTARAGMNVLLPELRMVSDGGLLAASRDSVRLRIPYAFGVLCRNDVAVLAPVDSAAYAAARHAGVAVRDSTGPYWFHDSVTVTGATTATGACDADSIRAIPGGARIELSAANLAPSGSVFYLYQVVTYRFANSADAALPGRRALWRQAQGARPEELLAPFDTAARFVFLVGSRLTPQLTVPASLATIRGLELRLVGASIAPAQGDAEPTRYALHPRIRFGNMLIP